MKAVSQQKNIPPNPLIIPINPIAVPGHIGIDFTRRARAGKEKFRNIARPVSMIPAAETQPSPCQPIKLMRPKRSSRIRRIRVFEVRGDNHPHASLPRIIRMKKAERTALAVTTENPLASFKKVTDR